MNHWMNLGSRGVALLALTSIVVAEMELQSAPPKLKPESLERVFGLIAFHHTPEAREKVLGKPTESHDDRSVGPWKRYKHAGTEGITHYESLGYWHISLPKGTTWQEAVRALGLKAENFTPKVWPKWGRTELVGKWEATGAYAGMPESILRQNGQTFAYAGDGAKNDQGKLVNPSGRGLPILIFDRSDYSDD